MSKFVFISLLGFLLLQSCSFKEKVTFNSDFSGDVIAELDLSQMAAANENTQESMMDSSMVANMEKLKSIDGISKVVYAEKSLGVIELSYHFKNVTALNAACQSMNDAPQNKNFEYFKLVNKKTLIIDIPNMGSDEEEVEMEGMGNMFTYDLTVVLPKKVKSISTKGEAEIQNTKEIHLASDLEKMSNKSFSPRVEVKL